MELRLPDGPAAQPGSYALCLHLEQPSQIGVGRLGVFAFPPGDYVYLGSAHGPGGLQARLGRHLRREIKPHWHIDALRAAARVTAGLYVIEAVAQGQPAAIPLECAWSQLLAGLPGAGIPAAHFGSRDCRCACPAHLVHFENMPAEKLNGLLSQNYGVSSATACWPWLRVGEGGLEMMLRMSVHKLHVTPSEPTATAL